VIAAWLLAAIGSSLAAENNLSEMLDEKIAVLDNVVLTETISRYSRVGSCIRKIDRRRALPRNGQTDGTLCFGDVATLLRTTREALSENSLFARTSGPEMVTTWHNPAQFRRWYVIVDSKTLWLEFEGKIRVSASGDLAGISWTSLNIPSETGISQITWNMDFHSVAIAGRTCTIPETAVYKVVHSGAGNREEWNETNFTAQGRYGSEVSVNFDR
jgi:hypothetical protein